MSNSKDEDEKKAAKNEDERWRKFVKALVGFVSGAVSSVKSKVAKIYKLASEGVSKILDFITNGPKKSAPMQPKETQQSQQMGRRAAPPAQGSREAPSSAQNASAAWVKAPPAARWSASPQPSSAPISEQQQQQSSSISNLTSTPRLSLK